MYSQWQYGAGRQGRSRRVGSSRLRGPLRDHTSCAMLNDLRLGPAFSVWPSVVRRHAFRRKVMVLGQGARYLGARHPGARHPGARYPEGQELGYRGRGRHRRYPGPKPETTDRCTRAEVAGIRIQPYRSSSTCPAGKAAVVDQRGRVLARRVQSAEEMPTRRYTRRCVAANTSLEIFSRLPLRGHPKICALSGGSNQRRRWRPWVGRCAGLPAGSNRPFNGECACGLG